MSTPSWRLPSVQIDLRLCALARLRLWLMLLPGLLLVSGRVLPVLVAAALLCLIDLWCSARMLWRSRVRFDGQNWWLLRGGSRDELLKPAGVGYGGSLLVALRLRRQGRGGYSLLVWRDQVDAESWRRLQLAMRYGTSMVSTASGAASG